jgi:predicted Ser/Thr protein kinase
MNRIVKAYAVGVLLMISSAGLHAQSAREQVSITFGDSNCNGVGMAQIIYLSNFNTRRSIRATLEITTHRGVEDKSQRVVTVSAGGKQTLDCTRTVTGNTGPYEITYRVVGAEYAN